MNHHHDYHNGHHYIRIINVIIRITSIILNIAIGYKEFVLVHMHQVVMLDGVTVAKEAYLQAEDIYYAQVSC